MIDCHCHLADKAFDNDVELIIQRSKEAKVEGIVVVAEFFSDFDKIIELGDKNPNFIYPCLGIHPIQVTFFIFNYNFIIKV